MENNRLKYNELGNTTRPISELIKIEILEARYNMLESVEKYTQLNFHSSDNDLSYIKSRTFRLFLVIYRMLERNMKAEEFNKLKENVISNDVNVLLKAINTLNTFLEDIGLTKIDTEEIYDPTEVYMTDKRKGAIG